MKKFSVKGRNARLLRRTSRQQVEDYFVSFPSNARSIKWLNRNNVYRLTCTSKFEREVKKLHPTINLEHLVAYVSSSSAAHVIDGWSYLGRAIEATLRGDSYCAIHFAYYAELRAAMGLLAGEGIGIFNAWHATIDETGGVEPFPVNAKPTKPTKRERVGTHNVIWPIVRHWSGLARAADLLDETVSPGSVPLSQWLEAVGARVPIRAVARQWLSIWGLDLATVKDDHDLRNLVSYRPSEFRRANGLNVHECTEFVEQLWRLFEPSSIRRFPTLERLLLRSAWRQSPATTVAEGDLVKLGLSPADAAQWASFITATDDPIPIRMAVGSHVVEDPQCHLSVIARATLLLFLATSIARRLLINGGYVGTDIAFWWERYGRDRGLWESTGTPTDPLDLWADVLLSITESETWRAANSGASSIRSWRRAQSAALDTLGGVELIGVWGLLP
jgi:hypothetical protein